MKKYSEQMHIFKRFLVFCLVAIISLRISAQTSDNFFTHEVKAGETLYSISTMYGVPVERIKELNPSISESIMAGQSIKIPRKNKVSAVRHIIQPGETLYRLTKTYNVSAQAICDANPGLNADNFKSGTAIIIPVSTPENSPAKDKVPECRQMYLVEKKETVYSISKKFGITEEELLAANPKITSKKKIKKGEYVCIPYSKDYVKPEPENKVLFNKTEPKTEKYATIKVAVILPFNLSESKPSAESMKMIEFYEGLLLAVDSLKSQGVSTDVYAYDEARHIDDILAHPMMKYVNVIFGPAKPDNINALADFADRNNIQLVIPFTSKEGVVNNKQNVYQINPPQTFVYEKVYEQFIADHSDDNIVMIGMNSKNDNEEFIIGLKKALEAKNVKYSRISFIDFDNLPSLLKRDGRRNIIIPSAGDQHTFEMLNYKMATMATLRNYTINMFGYPEWQTFSARNTKNIHRYGSTFFTTFYNLQQNHATDAFNRKFKNAFKRDQIKSYPRYAMLGFDVGYYFIKGLHLYGNKFADNQDKITYQSLQNPLKFVRPNNWSGFLNTSIMFVNYKENQTISKRVF